MKVSEDEGNLYDDYIENKYDLQADKWPPQQPTTVCNIALIHYKESQTRHRLFQKYKCREKDDPFKLMCLSRITRDLSILHSEFTNSVDTKEPNFVLIEGAPGVGKTALVKHITCLWADKEHLTEINRLLLSFLQRPELQDNKILIQLIQCFSSIYIDVREISNCKAQIMKLQTLSIVMDGFDECHMHRHEIYFLPNLIHDNVFCNFTEVLNSQSQSTVIMRLDGIVDCIVEIVGFAEEEHDKCISESSDSIKFIQDFLKSQQIVNGLVYAPYQLCYLHNIQSKIVETLIDIIKFFFHSINERLIRSWLITNDEVTVIGSLAYLPNNVLYIVRELTKLALMVSQNDQLVLLWDEIKQICPEFTKYIHPASTAFNDFDLLQAIQHFCTIRGEPETTASFSFLTFTIQEYSAALCVSNVLVICKEQHSLLMETKFWKSPYSFVLMMYVGKTVVEILYKTLPEADILKLKVLKFHDLKSKKCLHLFQCAMGAKNRGIMKQFSCTDDLYFHGLELFSYHILSTLYISNYTMYLETVNLTDCHIDDVGMNMLEYYFTTNLDTVSNFKHIYLVNNNSDLYWNVFCFSCGQGDCIKLYWSSLGKLNLEDIVGIMDYSVYVQSFDLFDNTFNDNDANEVLSSNIMFDCSINKLVTKDAVTISECLQSKHLKILLNNLIMEADRSMIDEFSQRNFDDVDVQIVRKILCKRVTVNSMVAIKCTVLAEISSSAVVTKQIKEFLYQERMLEGGLDMYALNFTLQRASLIDNNEEVSSPNNTASANSHQNDNCCHYNGFYCPECRKTVCACTVKDHIAYKNETLDSTNEKDDFNIANVVFNIVASSILFFALLSLLLKLNCLTLLSCTNVSQLIDYSCLDFHQYDEGISGKGVMLINCVLMNKPLMTSFTNVLIITDKKNVKCYQTNCAVVPDAASLCCERIQLKVNEPKSMGVKIIMICVILTFVATLSFCVVYDEFASTSTQATNISVVSSTNKRKLSGNKLENCKHLGSKVDLIPDDGTLHFNCDKKIFTSSMYLSKQSTDGNYSPKEMLKVGVKYYESMLINNVFQDISSFQDTLLHSRNTFERVASELTVALGGCNLNYTIYLNHKSLVLSSKEISEVCNQIMLEIYLNCSIKEFIKFNDFDMCGYHVGRAENVVCKPEDGSHKCSILTVNRCLFLPQDIMNLCIAYWPVLLLTDISNDITRPVGKDVNPISLPRTQQSFANPTEHEIMTSQVNHHSADEPVTTNTHTEDVKQGIQQSDTAVKDGDQPLNIQPEGFHIPASNATNAYSTHLEVERDGKSSFHSERRSNAYASLPQDAVEKDGKLSMTGGTDQATPLSNIPSAHEFMIGNVTTKSSGTADHNPSGAHIVKGLPKQTELLPTVGPQLDALYNTNFEHEVQSSREEVRQKRNARTTFYQHEFEQHAYNPVKAGNINLPKNPPVNDRLPVKVPEVKSEIGKAANDFKPKPLPKRSCVVYGGKQYPLVNNLISHPHMDHYFVKERKEIRPSHYLAKLVLCHQYLNRDDVNEDTTAATAAQQSQAAVLAADSAVEKDGAVTERKHFPMNLNMSGFVVFSSDLTRFTGNIKYPLPSRKATAVKLGKGGNGFVFAIFHNGKEYAVKKTVYRPNEIRVHSQLAHPNLVNLDAVLIGEEHEKHKGKFYAFCFMTKCDMDFRSVISTKEHGCLKHLKLQLSDQRDVWQLVMVNVKYVLKSVLKALDYMHKQGLVHRDVKASNILLKMQCHCSKPLMCACPQKYLVKLGDFDSSTTVPGHGLKIEPHQMIRYASVLPLGTMGYRAPEVSMHLVIAGPYEVLYTTAVDIWSFGCLLLNMLIGKCGPLKQRGEASLLLSTLNQPYAESLYRQIIKIKELQKYYGDMPEMVDLVRKCLQVEVHCRPTAKQLLQLDVLQCV